MKRLIGALFAIAVMLAPLSGSTALAGSRQIIGDDGNPTGITLITPDTYSYCQDTAHSDTITTTGVSSRQLKGQVIVEYVTDNGRQMVEGGFYAVDQTGDLNLKVSYPPLSKWPVLSNGTREIHVDVQIELFENGIKVATLGPSNDWDVYCVGGETPPPPPPPTGGQGCTPGYWKQPQHFDSYPAGYAPTMYFDQVFGVGPHITLAQALAAKGGGANALQRHATAALLNAANPNVNYAYTVQGVIDLVQQAYATGTFETVKNLFAAQNEMGCPLN